MKKFWYLSGIFKKPGMSNHDFGMPVQDRGWATVPPQISAIHRQDSPPAIPQSISTGITVLPEATTPRAGDLGRLHLSRQACGAFMTRQMTSRVEL